MLPATIHFSSLLIVYINSNAGISPTLPMTGEVASPPRLHYADYHPPPSPTFRLILQDRVIFRRQNNATTEDFKYPLCTFQLVAIVSPR